MCGCGHLPRNMWGFAEKTLLLFKLLTSSLLGVKGKIPGKLGILALLVEGNGLMKHFFHKSRIKMIYNAKACIYNDFLIITLSI